MDIVERTEPMPLQRRTPTAYQILLPLTLVLGLGCESAKGTPGAAKPDGTLMQPANAAAPANGSAHGVAGVGKFGAALGDAPAQKLATVLGEPAQFAGKPMRVEGHVRRACSAMGCWMELAESADKSAPACRVIMKGHAFFVPTDSAGSNARVEGTLDVRRIEPAQVAHMEEEGGTFPRKAADGSAEEVRLVASGVELWRGS